MGDSLERVRFFSKFARQQVGFELEMVQHGLEPSDWKPMRIVGPGVSEIRVHVGGEHRVLYVAKFQRAVYVLHAFIKRPKRLRVARSASPRPAMRKCCERRA